MSQPTTTYRKIPAGFVSLKVPKLVGSKWVYEYPVSASASKSNVRFEPNQPREIPIETENPTEKTKDWRGPWPRDNFGLKPRLIGGKLIKPKFIDY